MKVKDRKDETCKVKFRKYFFGIFGKSLLWHGNVEQLKPFDENIGIGLIIVSRSCDRPQLGRRKIGRNYQRRTPMVVRKKKTMQKSAKTMSNNVEN